nr:MAG TPA: hypothetical protein [Caudoviricetes sp.]
MGGMTDEDRYLVRHRRFSESTLDEALGLP